MQRKIDKNVLLVEREEDMIKSMSHFFQRRFNNCFTAQNASQALDICSKADVHILLADIDMPKAAGAALFDTLLERYPGIYPVALISGYATETDLKALTDRGIAVFCKPLDMHTLFAHINGYVGLNTAFPAFPDSLPVKMVNRVGIL